MQFSKSQTLIVGVLLASSAFASQATPRQRIGAIYAKMDELSTKGDHAGLKNLVSSSAVKEYVNIDVHGKSHSLSEVLTNIDKEFAVISKYKDFKKNTHITKIAPHGVQADLWMSAVVEFNAPGGKGQPAHRFVQTTNVVSNWTMIRGKWMIKQTKVLSQAATLDGKPFSPH